MNRTRTVEGAELTVTVGDRCTACGACLITCPTAALVPEPGRPSVLDGRCTGCLACVEICPVDAIKEVRWIR